MNILYIPTKDPRLTNGGNEQRTHLLWQALKSMGTVYTFMPNHHLDKSNEYIEGEHPIYKCKPIYIWKYHPFHILNVISKYFTSISLFSRLDTKIPNVEEIYPDVKFDVVVCRYVYNLFACDFSKIAPVYIDVDDHPYQVYETTRGIKLKGLFGNVCYKLFKYRINNVLLKSKGGWISNKEQLNLLPKSYAFLPNIPNVPSNHYDYTETNRNGLMTIGAMGYSPNYLGVDKFLKEIWPAFHRIFPDVKYTIGGAGAPTSLVDKWNSTEGVKYVGFIDDLEDAYQHCMATVVPINAGGGTCIKTLESLSYSRTCFSTPFGARGLEDYAKRQDGCLHLYNNAEEFINIYQQLLLFEDRTNREVLSRNFIEKEYSVYKFERIVNMTIREG